MAYPALLWVDQAFDGPKLDDVSAEVSRQLACLNLEATVKSGDRVAITAGSRGITGIHTILRAIVDFIRDLGGQPFIVPAMGSHGGANVDGQLRVLSSLGITAESMGCSIQASMETVLVCQSPEGVDIHFDRHAYEADHVVVCNRIKLHTDFTGQIQSGLMKMMLIGLGKHSGASIYHRAFRDHSFDSIAQSVSQQVIGECGVIAGLAIVENGYEETALIRGIRPDEIASTEPKLLQLSRQWMADLPFEDIDVLIVDEIGKNISGTGMDTNVVGRKLNENGPSEGETPRIKKIIVRDLTPETHGNATGIGVADYTTQHVIDQLDYPAMRVNCVTSGRTAVGMLPIYFPTEKEAVDAALSNCGLAPPDSARVVWIRNTLELQQIRCSAAMAGELRDRSGLKVSDSAERMGFTADGKLA